MARTPERERDRQRGRPPEPLDDEIEVVDPQTGRRYWMRPAEPGRYDYLGFSWVVWLVFWLVVIGLLLWAWAATSY